MHGRIIELAKRSPQSVAQETEVGDACGQACQLCRAWDVLVDVPDAHVSLRFVLQPEKGRWQVVVMREGHAYEKVLRGWGTAEQQFINDLLLASFEIPA